MAVQESKHDLGDSVSPVLVASWVRVALSCCCLQKALCMFEGQVLRPREDLKHGFPLFTQCEYMLISRSVSSLVEKKKSTQLSAHDGTADKLGDICFYLHR